MSSLSLKAYQALSRGGSEPDAPERAARPEGVLIWAIVQDDPGARAMLYLHERLMQVIGPCTLLISPANKAYVPPVRSCLIEPLPNDQTQAAQLFLDHWRPDMCIWLDGGLQPVLIAEAKSRAIPMMLVGATEDHMDQALWRWVPSLARETISAFDVVSAASHTAARYLRKLMLSRREFNISAPLQISSPAPTVDQAQFEELSDMTEGRSVWLAARVQEDEINSVLQAHSASIRLTHRLLLVMVCASFPVAMTARERLSKDGWRCAFWDDGDIIDENTQVVLVEEPDEMGLWLRLASVSFLASSIKSGYGGCDPYEAAALGTAIIYGPNVSAHLSSYSRLASAGAARIVSDANGLARALSHLLAVDQAASMAHAAWQTISTGAEATDQLVEQIQDLMDAHPRNGARDARA